MVGAGAEVFLAGFVVVLCFLAAVLVCVVGCFFDGLRTIISCAFTTRTHKRNAKMVMIRFILSGVSCLFMILHYRVHYLIPIKLVRKLRIIFEKHTRVHQKIDNRPTQIDIFSSLGITFQGQIHIRSYQGVCDTPVQLPAKYKI